MQRAKKRAVGESSEHRPTASAKVTDRQLRCPKAQKKALLQRLFYSLGSLSGYGRHALAVFELTGLSQQTKDNLVEAKLKALFVDNDSESADSLAALAAAMGHEVFTAYDGKTALNVARNTAFDLILLDIRLGNEDGREVCAGIRQEGLSQHSHIIAITGYVGLEGTLNLGDFNGYAIKPIEFDRLEELLT